MFVCSTKFVDRFTVSRLMLPGILLHTLLLEYGVAMSTIGDHTDKLLVSYW